MVTDIRASALGDAHPGGSPALQHLVGLSSVEDDGLGESADVVWELEPGARVLPIATLLDPVLGRLDPPATQAAFLDAIRWGAVTSADASALQGPFRSGDLD